MDQFDPWQVVPKRVFTPYCRRLISIAFVVVSRVGCLGVTSVVTTAKIVFASVSLRQNARERKTILFYGLPHM